MSERGVRREGLAMLPAVRRVGVGGDIPGTPPPDRSPGVPPAQIPAYFRGNFSGKDADRAGQRKRVTHRHPRGVSSTFFDSCG